MYSFYRGLYTPLAKDPRLSVPFALHCSFSMLWGPTNHLKHLINIERLPFSITYLVTLIATIYYSVWVSVHVINRKLSASASKEMSPVIDLFEPLIHRSSFRCAVQYKTSDGNDWLCVVEKERRLALPLTRTEGLRTYTITPGKAWRLTPVTWLVFFPRIIDDSF